MDEKDHARFLVDQLYKLKTEERHIDFFLSFEDKVVKCHAVVMAMFSNTIDNYLMSGEGRSLTTLNDPEYLVDMLYKWRGISYKDFKCNIESQACELEILFVTESPFEIKDDTTVAYLNHSHVVTFSKRLQTLWKTGCASDIVLNVDGQTFECHKVILAAMSSYFDAMFMSGLDESMAQKITLHGIEKETMLYVLVYIYTGKLDINHSNAVAILSAAGYFLMPELQDICGNFLMKNVSIHNCVELIRQVDMYKLRTEFKSVAMEFILYNYSDLVQKRNDAFVRLTVDEMIYLICSDYLIVKNENFVLRSVFQWFEGQEKKTDEKLYSILKYVRFKEIHPKWLSKTFKTYVGDREYSLCGKIFQNIHNEEDVHGSNRKDEVLLVFRSNNFSRVMDLFCFSFLRNTWYELPKMNFYYPGTGYSACFHNDSIFVSGGTWNSRGFAAYDCEQNKWVQLACLSVGRCEHCMCASGDSVYVIGGKHFGFPVYSSIHKYCGMRGVWTVFGNLKIAVCNASAICVDEYILVFGGTRRAGEFTRVIQCFDTKTKSCTEINTFPDFITSSVVETCGKDDYIFAVTTGGYVLSIFRQDLQTIKDVVRFHDETLIGFSVVHRRNNIYLIGDFESHTREKKVMQLQLPFGKRCPCRLRLPINSESNQYFAAICFMRKKHLLIKMPKLYASKQIQ